MKRYMENKKVIKIEDIFAMIGAVFAISGIIVSVIAVLTGILE